MTAKEKFTERAKELGVCMESDGTLHAGFEIDDMIVILVANGDGGYFEFHYPSFEKLKKAKGFPEACISHYMNNFSHDFNLIVCEWLFGKEACPLAPLDVYYIDENLSNMIYSKEYTDDKDIVGYGDIINTLTKHDRKLVGMINERYNRYGALEFLNAISSLFGNMYSINMKVCDGKLYEQLPIREYVYEVLEHWCDDANLMDIIVYIDSEHDPHARYVCDEKGQRISKLIKF